MKNILGLNISTLLILIQIFAISSLASINHKEREEADRLYLKAKYQEASQAYIKIYQKVKGPEKFDYLFLSTKSLFATQKKASIQIAEESINTLLTELETNHPLFYRTLLLRSMINYKLGNFSKALLQFEASLRYSSNKEGARELALCQIFQKSVKNNEASTKCANQLKGKFTESYWAKKGFKINTKVRGPDYRKPAKNLKKKSTTKKKSTSKANDSKGITNGTQKNIDTSPSSEVSNNLYSIQVGAFGSKENAEFLKENLSILKKPIVISERKNASGTLHLVRIQGFKSKSEAESYAQDKVAPQGLTYRVYKN